MKKGKKWKEEDKKKGKDEKKEEKKIRYPAQLSH